MQSRTTSSGNQLICGDAKANLEILKRILLGQHESSAPKKRIKKNSDHKIAFIGNDYTFQLLRHEADILLLTPDNWQLLLEFGEPELVLLESSFHTVTGDWDFQQSTAFDQNQVLVRLIDYCRKFDIPIVFWNTFSDSYAKYFEVFSSHFDRVYYADLRLATHYESVRTDYLPPAIQPKYWNPMQVSERNNELLYDGIVDLLRTNGIINALLAHLQETGLLIIDSCNSIFKKKCESLGPLKKSLVGSVQYIERQKFLNSSRFEIVVEGSADRIRLQQMALEAAACKTLVLNSGELDPADVRKGLIAEFKSEFDIVGFYNAIKNDDNLYAAFTLDAWRKVNSEHTIGHRLKKIFSDIGACYCWQDYPLVSVISPTNRMHQLNQVLTQYDRQIYPHKELVVVINSRRDLPDDFKRRIQNRADVKILRVPEEKFTGFCLKAGYAQAEGVCCFKMDDDDYYGEHYISDMMLYQRGVDASFFGQPPGDIYFEDDRSVYGRSSKLQENIVIEAEELTPGRKWIGGNTISGKTQDLQQLTFDDTCFGTGDTALLLAVKKSQKKVAIFPKQNMVVIRKPDKERHHTWTETENYLKSCGKLRPESFENLKSTWKGRSLNSNRELAANKRNLAEPIAVGLASIPDRIHQLFATLLSIIHQVDHIYVYLNNYESIPDFLDHAKISVYTSETHGDLGAAGKFFKIDDIKTGYYFTIDDDIIYPSDYVERIVSTLQKYKNTVAVCVHGSIFGAPIEWYFERTKVFNMLKGLKQDMFVTLAGSGCLAFYRPSMQMRFKDYFPEVMCDLKFSIMAREQGIPIISLARPSAWLRPQKKISNNTYYDWMLFDDGRRTEVAQKYDWSFTEYRKMVEVWLAKLNVTPEVALQKYNLDTSFLRHLSSQKKIPWHWDTDKRKLILRRKLQYYRILTRKQTGIKADQADDLFPSIWRSRRSLKKEIQKLQDILQREHLD
jgi:hypothetical protein